MIENGNVYIDSAKYSYCFEVLYIKLSNENVYILELPCKNPSHKAIVLRCIIQSFIYKKYLVYDPAQTDCVDKNHKSLSSFNGVRSFFLTDEDFVGSVNSGR